MGELASIGLLADIADILTVGLFIIGVMILIFGGWIVVLLYRISGGMDRLRAGQREHPPAQTERLEGQAMRGTWQCLGCGNNNAQAVRFCTRCGNPRP